MGGIGNQLFILGAGLALADHLTCRLHVDSSLNLRNPKAPPLIEQLISGGPDGLSATVLPYPAHIGRLRRSALRLTVPRTCSYVEPSFAFDPAFFSLQRGACIFGYFQSWRYLEALSSERRLQLRAAIRARAESTEAPWNPNDVVVHVRRGDYLQPGTTEVHGALAYQYYACAVKHLRNLGFDGQVWLVAEESLPDQDEWSKALGGPVGQVGGSSLWQDLSMLMDAPSLVIANSTFSWMGGWLSKCERPVVAPIPWFRDRTYDTKDLLPPQWTVVPHAF